ncbi:MAG: hypothetical protein IBJ11_11620 [Phycisphaerales bacterium]|nr:hypothetical protein [Phycisphaerales bacterium]
MRSRALPIFAAAAVLSVLCACSSGPGAPTADPSLASYSSIADEQAREPARIASINQAFALAEARQIPREQTRETLKKVAWAARNRPAVRLAAVDALTPDDPADTANMVRLLVASEPSPDMVRGLADRAAKNNWTQTTSGFVSRWARITPNLPDDTRPERDALSRLHPGRPIPDVIYDVLTGKLGPAADPSSQSAQRERQAAWGLLRRVDPDNRRTIALLTADSPEASADPMLATLRLAASELRVVPETAEQVVWVQRLRAAQGGAFWTTARAAAARLTPEQAEGLALRHIPAVVFASAHRTEWLAMTRAQLLAEARRRIDAKPHVFRSTATPGGDAYPPETLRAHDRRLPWADLLLVLIAADLAADRTSADALFAAVERDRADASTEHGGCIDADDAGRFTVRVFEPRAAQRLGDDRFVASPELLDASDTALFHFHFHARAANLAPFAGPSQADIDYARLHGRACVVFTSLSNSRLNADVFFPTSAVIDLGPLDR